MAELKYDFTLQEVIDEKKVTMDEVDSIKIWNSTVNLPVIPEELCVIFIIACGRNLESTKKAIWEYFMCKKQSPDLFSNRNIDNEELILSSNTVYQACMPVRTDDDCVVFFMKLHDTNYRNFHYDHLTKLMFMVFDSCMNIKSPPSGVKLIADFKGAGLMHILRCKLKTLIRIVHFVQEAMPVHMKEIHLINSSYVAEKIISLCKPFMRSELLNKMIFHPIETDMDRFSKNFIPKKCLPIDYGGQLPPLEELKEKTNDRHRELREFFKNEEKLWKE